MISNKYGYNIVWPENLDDIKITNDEKATLESRIQSMLNDLAKKTANSEPFISRTRNADCPRKIIVNHEHCFIILNNHGGMPSFDKSGAQQQKIRYVWDCRSGKLWLKKSFATQKQKDAIHYLIYAQEIGYSSSGLPKLVLSENELKPRLRYFEEKAMLSLPEWFKKKEKIKIMELIGLMDGLRKIHCVTYQPATFIAIDHSFGCQFNISHALFHGDISPNNILFDQSIGQNHSRFMLTDFHSLGDLNNLCWTSGWASPECIQFAKTKTKYQEMSGEQFLAKYGAKKDTWAMGLILGSLYRGGLFPNKKQHLPCFSFIVNKLKFDPSGKYVVDETGIADLTQAEIDSKLNALINNESDENLKELLKCIKSYLTVDPDKRPTVHDRHLDVTKE